MARLALIAAAFVLVECGLPTSERHPIFLGAVTAHAQRADGRDEVARQRALDLLDESAVLYREGRFTEAADRLRRAHDLHPDPALLYNLGRALDAAGDAPGAADAYARYLEAEPESHRRGEVQARIEALRRTGAAGENGAQSPVEQEEPPLQDRQLPPEEREPPPGESGPSLLGPAIVLAASGTALAGGLVLGILAQARQDDALDAPSHRERLRLDDEAGSLATGANVLFAVGGVAAAAGLVWLLVATSDDDGEHAGVTAVLVGPGSVELRGHF